MTARRVRHEVLIVDDDVVLAGLIALALEDAGFVVVHAATLSAAMALVDDADFALVVLDIELGRGESGLTLLRRLRAEGRPTSGIVLLSGHADDTITNEALDAGLSDVIRKPIDLALLTHKLQAMLARRRTATVPEARSASAAPEPPAPRYCRACQSYVSTDTLMCARCNMPRPSRGWPQARGEATRRLGGTISRYRFMQVIGRGSAGVVYRATHGIPPRDVAIKLITFEHLAEEQLTFVRHEVRAASEARGPHTAAVREVLAKRNQVALVMDLVRGVNLKRWVLDHGTLDPERALMVARQVCDALSRAHGRGIIHRDVKPANIHVEEQVSGRLHVTLLDFGIAYAVGQQTAPDRFFGTPAYAAPEQLASPETVDGRADLYALGCVICFMLKGEPPFAASSAAEQLYHHAESPVPRITLPNQDVPAPIIEGLNELIKRLLAKRPADRYASATDAASAIGLLEKALRRAGRRATDSQELMAETESRALSFLYNKIRDAVGRKEALSRRYQRLRRRRTELAPEAPEHDTIDRQLRSLRADAAELKEELSQLRRAYKELRPRDTKG